jgi:hypothetical protein
VTHESYGKREELGQSEHARSCHQHIYDTQHFLHPANGDAKWPI